MKYVPHEYQQFATDFIVTHPTAAIFLDMGMGKSSITLTAIERLMYQEFEVFFATRRGAMISTLHTSNS